MLRVLLSATVAFILALGFAACTEEEGAGTRTPAATVTPRATPTPPPPTVTPEPTTGPLATATTVTSPAATETAQGTPTPPPPTAPPEPTTGPLATPTSTPIDHPTPTPAPGGPQLGTWRGTTSQGKPIEFDVVEGSPGSRAIGRIQFDFVGTSAEGKSCSGGRGEGSTSIPIVNNEFSLDRMEYGDFEISGRFDSATTASGDLEYSGFALPPDYDPCHAGHTTWTASFQ